MNETNYDRWVAMNKWYDDSDENYCNFLLAVGWRLDSMVFQEMVPALFFFFRTSQLFYKPLRREKSGSTVLLILDFVRVE